MRTSYISTPLSDNKLRSTEYNSLNCQNESEEQQQQQPQPHPQHQQQYQFNERTNNKYDKRKTNAKIIKIKALFKTPRESQ